MRSNSQGEGTDDKKRYVFFSDPDVVAKRAENSAIAAQIRRDSEAQRHVTERQSADVSLPVLGAKGLENLLFYHPVQPYPFTFISAVKQKLALGNHPDVGIKAHDLNSHTRSNLTSSLLKTNSTQNLYQTVKKMEFIKPLKVPDLKVSPKTLNFSNRENSVSKELPVAKPSELAAIECAHDRFERTPKIGERVQRKLDFSSDGPSAISCDGIEPLKAPNVSIASNFSKKKEHTRDISREKENRSKRLKKDADSSCGKKDESVQDQAQAKRSKSPRRVFRRETVDSASSTIATRVKNDRLPFHATKSNDLLVKSKIKSFTTPIVKKDTNKRQKSFNVLQSALARDERREIPSDSKSRVCSNKALDFPSGKLPDSITTRDNVNIVVLSGSNESKSKDVADNRQSSKQDKPSKEQIKRMSDKSKALSCKIEGKMHSVNSETEDIGSASETSSSKNRTSVYPISAQLSKSKDFEITIESQQSASSIRSSKVMEGYKCAEHSATQSTSANTKKDEESYSQSVVTTKQTSTIDDTNMVDVDALPDALFDPRRISFRDNSYSKQEEFDNLITPDKIDIALKSKQRRYLMQSSDSEIDAKCPKYKPVVKSDKEQEKVQLMHPTALHMQFQAELHLLDSFNESLRHVMDVEKCLYSIKHEQGPKNSEKENEESEEIEVGESRATAADIDIVEKTTRRSLDYAKKDIAETRKLSACDEAHFAREHYVPNQGSIDELSDNFGKFNKMVKVAEVQTQTVNDMATQTDVSEIRSNTYGRQFAGKNEVPQLFLDSVEEFEDMDRIEEISLPRIGTMSEISLHETTSSIRTETGTEISISTRDITCSFKSREFNKYLDLEIQQLIKDEDKRYDKYEMLFKSRQKTLNDKTRKLVKLQEQKRALKDKGEESRVSSLKKKQRAVLLKIEQERHEIDRLKELHHVTSQERKHMLQKQRDMLNLQMSTKDILTKLKRSADSQSPRRLSGPMKGYDILSNSSISSLIDSDKSQHDRFQVDSRLQVSEGDLPKLDLKIDKFINLTEESNTSATKFDEIAENNEPREQQSSLKSQKKSDMSKYELKSRKYEDKMPKAHVLRLKQNQLDMESKRIESCPMKIKRLMENQIEMSPSSKPKLDSASVPDYVKSESDTLVEELSKKSKTSQALDSAIVSREKEPNTVTANSESIEEELSSKAQDVISKTTKSSQVSEDILRMSVSKSSKKTDKMIMGDRDVSKKQQHGTELRASSKRKSSKHQKMKSSSSMLTEDVLRSKPSCHVTEELTKHHDKQARIENELLSLDNNESLVLGELDLNKSQSSLQTLVRHSKAVKDKSSRLLNEMMSDYESKENIPGEVSSRKFEIGENFVRNERSAQDVSASQISTFAISHHSSEESERNFSKSVVIRSQDRDFKASKKLEQILTARETALASRKNCVDEWMAWHTRLRAEEERVIRMEQAALKLVAATSSVLSQQDTTVSSDTSDVEGRIEMLTKKLAERRIELSRLKREARKQTKQKLRALEANLLNQIKKYDTTIYEMRRKLESKRIIRDDDKLAIEPRSLADFKVPEIPLKRIQDLYRSNDLLRSRSESDLLLQNFSKTMPSTAATYNNRHERSSSQRSTRSADVKSTNVSESKSIIDVNRSARSTFEECTSTEEREKLRTITSASSNGVRSEKFVSDMEAKGESASRDAEDFRTILDTVRSGSEVRTISNTRSSEDRYIVDTESSDNRLLTHTSADQSQLRTSQSEILDETRSVNCTRSIPESVHPTESVVPIAVANSNRDALSFSKKLDFLQLNNRNLNEDISSLENGLKVLSEMVSRFNDKANDKSKLDNDERSTSQDISEIMSEPILGANTVNEERRIILSEKEIDIESFPTSIDDGKSKSSNLSRDKCTLESVNSTISAVIPEEALSLSDSTHEIDYEAKSKEIMNEIERSIISEYTKVARGDYNVSTVLENDMQNLRKDNEELLSDLASLELDIKSISEIRSKISDSRRSLGLAASTTIPRIVDDSKWDADTKMKPDEAKSEEDLAKYQTSLTQSLKFADRAGSTLMHSPIIAGHRSKEIYETNLRDARTSVSSQTSYVPAGEDVKSLRNIPEMLEGETNIIDDAIGSKNLERDKNIRTALVDDSMTHAIQNQSRTISAENVSVDKDNWTTSDSFEIPQNEISVGKEGREEGDSEFENSESCLDTSYNFPDNKSVSRVDDTTNHKTGISSISDVDASTFIPRGESTNVGIHNVTLTDTHVMKSRDELDDILDIIAREIDKREKSTFYLDENVEFDNVIMDSMADLLDKVEDIVESDLKNVVNSCSKEILRHNKVNIFANNYTEAISNITTLDPEIQNKIDVKNSADNRKKLIDISLRAIGETDDKSAIDVSLCAKIDNEDSPCENASETREIVITELDSDGMEDHILSELEIDAKVELAEEEEVSDAKNDCEITEKSNIAMTIQECLEPIFEQDSSDGEQLDNLVEIAVSGLDTVEKLITPSRVFAKSLTGIDYEEEDEKIPEEVEETEEETVDIKGISKNKMSNESAKNAPIASDLNKTFDILKDPDYEDISEESLEVSEILDKNELSRATMTKKSTDLPEKYQAVRKSEEVLKILDKISQKSSPDSTSDSHREERDARSATAEISELLDTEVSVEDNISSAEINEKMVKDNRLEERLSKAVDESKDFMEEATSQEKRLTEKAANDADPVEEKSGSEVSSRLAAEMRRSSQIIYELREKVSQLQEQNGSSESSEAGDTPRGVSDIELDSPRDFNDSRLDIDILDDDLLSSTKTASQNVDVKTNFHSSSIVATSEKDIEAMIDKLKASLEQPGSEVAELEAKLLRIEQLEIELEIKKLEAEEVSYYVREIPNKPPPPYTPPGDGRMSGSLGSPSLLTVIPSNVDELTSFTERATALIYNDKLAGEDVANLEAPTEIYESIKEKDETVKKDRRIYNTFLFDLCKETIAEVYHTEHEKPGPSWTKPNVKTKPTMKIPRTVEELTEYVSKEVATLFGFKTKLQRENMVMRWSRKRRDRVDELLAREAQAEEDEWTKFHHDELAVKNDLTITILNTLVMETANVVKVAYGKKRRMMI